MILVFSLVFEFRFFIFGVDIGLAGGLMDILMWRGSKVFLLLGYMDSFVCVLVGV